MYKMTLVDGTTVEFSGVNGNNFIVPDQEEMDVSVFTDDNLEGAVVVTEDGEEIECHNLSFTQQQKQLSGDYYVCFHEKSTLEVEEDEVRSLIIQLAEIAIGDGKMELDDIKGSLKDDVEIAMGDDKHIEL